MATDREMLERIEQRITAIMDAVVHIAGQLTAQVDVIRQMQQQMEGAGGESDLADTVQTILHNTVGIHAKIDNFHAEWRADHAKRR